MEQGQTMPQTASGERKYIGDGTWHNLFASVEEARESFQEVIDFARERGWELGDGMVALSRERDPAEAYHFGSTTTYRNLTAEGSWGELAGEITHSPVGEKPRTTA